MTCLEDALATLGLRGESELGGTWLTLFGERWRVYVIGKNWGTCYYTWGGDPEHRTVEMYRDASMAIQRGLQRAANPRSAPGSPRIAGQTNR